MKKRFFVCINENLSLIVEAKDVEMQESGSVVFYTPNKDYPNGKEICAFFKNFEYKFFAIINDSNILEANNATKKTI